MIERNEELEVGGIKATDIVSEYGTPLYVYDAEKIRSQYRRLEEAFSNLYSNFQINYAVKANFNPEIVKILVEEGAGLDCASMAELKLSEELGADELLYTAPYNTEKELEFALDSSATLNLDSVFLIDKIREMPEEICFRIDPGMGKENFGLAFAGGDAKFGIPEERALEAYRRAKNRGAQKFGIHMMTGSNVRDPEYFAQITERLLQIAGNIKEELGIDFEFIDIGGGLGIPYKPGEKQLELEETARKVVETFRNGLEENNLEEPELRLEPGRFLVGEAGVLLTKVTGVKEKQEKRYVGIDTGMHQNLRPMLLDAYHEIIVANDLDRSITGEKTVVGPVCSSVDVMADGRPLPKLEQGDLLSIMDIGAYGFSMASHWNTRPLPAEVLVENGEKRIIRQSEDLGDVFHGTEYEGLK